MLLASTSQPAGASLQPASASPAGGTSQQQAATEQSAVPSLQRQRSKAARAPAVEAMAAPGQLNSGEGAAGNMGTPAGQAQFDAPPSQAVQKAQAHLAPPATECNAGAAFSAVFSPAPLQVAGAQYVALQQQEHQGVQYVISQQLTSLPVGVIQGAGADGQLIVSPTWVFVQQPVAVLPLTT
jgi:hypothetical protein